MSAVPGSVKTFNCPNCGGSVAIRAEGISITATCQSCHSLIDIANDNFSIISKATSKIRHTTIPIGARGSLFDVEWEVIGYTERQCGSGEDIYSWEEYLLFNPWQGFRFLVQSDGHWTFVKMLRQDVHPNDTNTIECDKKTYRLFSRDTAKVTYVMGEFYWRVKVGDKAQVADYIAPPYILSREESDGDFIWSQGIYVDSKDIQKAFNLQFVSVGGIEYGMLEPHGIAPNQPSSVGKYVSGIMQLAGAFFAALLLIQSVVMARAENKTVFSQEISIPPEQKGQVFSSEPFELTGRKANVEIRVTSPVDNNWLELNSSLTHQETQETFESSQNVEYYHGWDSDGAWSEGSQINDTMLSAVPGGTYRLLLAPDAGAYSRGLPANFSVTVKRDVPVWSNFYAALVALLLYPLIIMLWNYSFERKRWADSDFAPQQYRSGNNS